MSKAAPKKIFKLSLLSRVFQFVRPYTGFFYASILLAVVMAFFAPIRPYLIQLTIDTAAGKAVHVPVWLQFVLIKSPAYDAVRFIISVTIFQVIFLFIETSTNAIY